MNALASQVVLSQTIKKKDSDKLFKQVRPITAPIARTAPVSGLHSRKNSARNHQQVPENVKDLTVPIQSGFTNVKPRLIETGMGKNELYLKISSGFKKIFA